MNNPHLRFTPEQPVQAPAVARNAGGAETDAIIKGLNGFVEADAPADIPTLNQFLHTLMNEVPIGCYILQPDHTVLYWNREAERLLGFSTSEMRGKRCVDMPLGCSFVTGESMPTSSCPAVCAFATGKAQTTQMFMRKKDGSDLLIRNTLVPLRGRSGTVVELVSFFTPLTDESYDHKLVQAIYETATKDPLTCLPGRKYMEARLEDAIEVFKRTNHPFAVLFVDANDFHNVNNTYGHAAGDAVLREIGLALRTFGRKSDAFCRWGGDEFVGLLQLRQHEDIEGAAHRMLKFTGSREITVNGQKISCQTSIGITVVREDDDVRSIVQRADDYMYQAKRRKNSEIVTDTNAE